MVTSMPDRRRQIELLISALAGSFLIFAIDLAVPLGIAVPMGYMAVLLIALWSNQAWMTMSLAGSGMMFTGLGYLLSAHSTGSTQALTNRGIAVALIALAACLILWTQHAQQEARMLRRFILMCASCRKIRDEHGDWRGLEQYLEQRTNLLFSHGLCPRCIEKWYPELYPEIQFRHPELFGPQLN
jgi:hypothetical protein